MGLLGEQGCHCYKMAAASKANRESRATASAQVQDVETMYFAQRFCLPKDRGSSNLQVIVDQRQRNLPMTCLLCQDNFLVECLGCDALEIVGNYWLGVYDWEVRRGLWLQLDPGPQNDIE